MREVVFVSNYASSSLLGMRDTRREDARSGGEAQHWWWWSLVPGREWVSAQRRWEIQHIASEQNHWEN